MNTNENFISLEGEIPPAEEAPPSEEAPPANAAVEDEVAPAAEEDIDPKGTWRIISNPGKTSTSEGVDASITIEIGKGEYMHKPRVMWIKENPKTHIY